MLIFVSTCGAGVCGLLSRVFFFQPCLSQTSPGPLVSVAGLNSSSVDIGGTSYSWDETRGLTRDRCKTDSDDICGYLHVAVVWCSCALLFPHDFMFVLTRRSNPFRFLMSITKCWDRLERGVFLCVMDAVAVEAHVVISVVFESTAWRQEFSWCSGLVGSSLCHVW